MDHLPRCHIIQDHCGRIAIRDTVGDRKKVFGLAYEKFRETPVDSEGGHALAQPETGDPSADGRNYACDFITRHERYLWRVAIVSNQHDQVGRPHPGSAHPHA
jgi:hypothetical protein